MIFGRRHLEEVLRVYVARYGHRSHRGLDLGAALAAPAPAQSVSPVLPSGSVGVFVTGFDGPPLTLRVHEDPVPPGWNRTAHGIVTPFVVLHHAKAKAWRGPGDVGDLGHGGDRRSVRIVSFV